jgi:hypothetical protein
VIDIAVSNMKQCVVGILERWDETIDVINHWFPWIDFTSNPTRRRMFLYSGKETLKTIRPELLEVLHDVNKCDMILYEEMILLFNKQISIFKPDYFYQ